MRPLPKLKPYDMVQAGIDLGIAHPGRNLPEVVKFVYDDKPTPQPVPVQKPVREKLQASMEREARESRMQPGDIKVGEPVWITDPHTPPNCRCVSDTQVKPMGAPCGFKKWEDWNGEGLCPLPLNLQVKVITRDGTYLTGLVREFKWSHTQLTDEDVKGYWVMEPQPHIICQGQSMNDEPRWNEWEGGECPVSKDTQVEAQFIDGTFTACFAGHLVWKHGSTKLDLVRYRIVGQWLPTKGAKLADGIYRIKVPERQEVIYAKFLRVWRVSRKLPEEAEKATSYSQTLNGIANNCYYWSIPERLLSC